MFLLLYQEKRRHQLSLKACEKKKQDDCTFYFVPLDKNTRDDTIQTI